MSAKKGAAALCHSESNWRDALENLDGGTSQPAREMEVIQPPATLLAIEIMRIQITQAPVSSNLGRPEMEEAT